MVGKSGGCRWAVVEMVLGHSPDSVTGRYVGMTNEDCVLWLNRAAALIDGEP
jgi:hypothetical protein